MGDNYASVISPLPLRRQKHDGTAGVQTHQPCNFNGDVFLISTRIPFVTKELLMQVENEELAPGTRPFTLLLSSLDLAQFRSTPKSMKKCTCKCGCDSDIRHLTAFSCSCDRKLISFPKETVSCSPSSVYC